MKRILCFALCIVLAVSLLPASALADAEYRDLVIQSSVGGSVTATYDDDTPVTGEGGCVGEDIVLTVSPVQTKSSYYELTSLTVSYNDGTDDKTASLSYEGLNQYSFEMPAYDVTVTAEFAIMTAKVTVADGYYEADDLPFYYYSDTVGIKSQTLYPASMLTGLTGESIAGLRFYPDESSGSFNATYQVYVQCVTGKSFNGALINTGAAAPVYTGTLSIRNSMLDITFAEPFSYTGGDLLITFDTATTGTYTTSVDFYGIEYEAAGVLSYPGDDVYTENVLPKLTFLLDRDAVVYDIACSTANGTVTGPAFAAEGSMVHMTAQANQNYALRTVSVADCEVFNYYPDIYFTMPSRSVTVDTVFDLLYSVTADSNITNGTISFNDDEQLSDSTVSVRLSPAAGYVPVQDSVTVTYGGQTVTASATEDVLVYTFPMPASPVTVSAQFAAAGTLFAGDGTENSPFLISGIQDLDRLAYQVNSGACSAGYFYKLTADIDLSGRNWTPIGNYDHRFCGTLDGNGKSVTGLSCVQEGYAYYAGLFGYTQAAVIKNLTLSGSVTGYEYNGLLVGYADDGLTVTNCTVQNGTVTGEDDYNGLLVGYVDDGLTVTGCTVSGTVSGEEECGLLAGYVDDGLTVTDCTATGTVNAEEECGLLVGYAYNSVSVTGCTATGTVNGGQYSGFLIGKSSSTPAIGGCTYGGTLYALFNTGDLVGNCTPNVTAPNTNQGLTVKLARYEGGEKQKMGYLLMPEARRIDVIGNYHGNWIKTTYRAGGYRTTTQNVPSDASITVDATRFDYDENYVRMVFTLTAGATPIRNGKLGVSADVQIGQNDAAPITVSYNENGRAVGFEMSDNKSHNSSYGAAFRFVFGDMPGVTPVDTWWTGGYSGYNSYSYYVFEQLTDATKNDKYGSYTKDGDKYTGYANNDSALCVSWQDIDLRPGESRRFCVLLGIGAYSEAPEWAANPKLSMTVNSDSVDVSTSVSNPNSNPDGNTVYLYCDLDGKNNTLIGSAAVAADEQAVPDVKPISKTGYSLAGLENGDHLLRFSLMNDTGRLADTVVSKVVRISNGSSVPLHTFTGTLPGQPYGKEIREVVAIPHSENFGDGNIEAEGEVELTVDTAVSGGTYTYSATVPGGSYSLIVRFTDGTSAEYPLVLRELVTDSCGGSEVSMDFSNETGLITRSADPVRAGYVFGGWYSDREYQNAWNFGSDTVAGKVTLYAKWIEDEAPSRRISGNVTMNGSIVPGAVVELYLGNEKVAATTTDINGDYGFDFAENGSYNIVVSKDGKVRTTVITLTSLSQTVPVELPGASVNSRLEVAEDAPAMVVGGIDEIAAAEAEEGHDVEIVMAVDEVAAAAADGSVAIAALTEAEDQTITYYDIKIDKYVDALHDSSIHDTDSLVRILIPFDCTGKEVITVYRYHNGVSEPMTENPAAGAEGFSVDRTNNLITILAKRFSTYAIGYGSSSVTPPVTPPVTPVEPVTPVLLPSTGGCPQNSSCVYAKYTDADPAAWYHDGVHYCVEKGIMQGVSADSFAPGGTLSRAMIVTMLWRMEGSPVVNYAMSFTDVAAGQWYAEAVRWAQSTGVVTGYSDAAFGPQDNITREQLAAILMRYAAYKSVAVSVRADLAKFSDAGTISAWARDSVSWANAAGLLNGRTTAALVPDGTATRAEAACMVQRFCENILG